MERYIQLSAVTYVDEIIPYNTETELLALLSHLPLDVRIIGEDYYGKNFTGKALVPVYYNKRRHEFSTSGLRERVIAKSDPLIRGTLYTMAESQSALRDREGRLIDD
jgi:glycerol-3-phosphate cytidylyltransferase|tara:strand:- start:1817 stop:2137 length:321 start_codon:yes stop_codon:yes gene_type:complete